MNMQAKWANTMNMGCEARQHERDLGSAPSAWLWTRTAIHAVLFTFYGGISSTHADTAWTQSGQSAGADGMGNWVRPEALAVCSRWGCGAVNLLGASSKSQEKRRPGESTAGMVQSFFPEEAGILLALKHSGYKHKLLVTWKAGGGGRRVECCLSCGMSTKPQHLPSLSFPWALPAVCGWKKTQVRHPEALGAPSAQPLRGGMPSSSPTWLWRASDLTYKG